MCRFPGWKIALRHTRRAMPPARARARRSLMADDNEPPTASAPPGVFLPPGEPGHTGHTDTLSTQTNLTSAIQTHQRTRTTAERYSGHESVPTDPSSSPEWVVGMCGHVIGL
jgi:hypothetical protein